MSSRSGAAGAGVLVRCEGLVIGHEGKALLPPIDLEIHRGRLLLVAGRNGSGKSTWLATLLGLLPPVAGRVAHARPRMAYVPQTAALDDILPVRAGTVVSWGRLRGWSFLRPFASRDDRDACRSALAETGAGALAAQELRALSGGQRQRVLFARLLAGDADLALLDEPTASMDVPGQRAAYARMAALARERRMAVVVVTHTVSTSAAYAHEILFLDRDDDGVHSAIVHGPPAEVFAHPHFVRLFGAIDAGAPAAEQAAGSAVEET